MEAGQIIAYSQLAVKEKSCCGHCASKQASTPADKNVKAKLIDRKGEADLAVITPDLTLKISRATGLISAFTCQGKSLLGEGGTLKPNFWRAPADNTKERLKKTAYDCAMQKAAVQSDGPV